jgi:hypothetical protein
MGSGAAGNPQSGSGSGSSYEAPPAGATYQ